MEYLYGKDADQPILDRVAQVARERDLPAAQISLAWLLHQAGLTAPIIGATKDRHIDDAVAAVGVSLSDKELDFLAEPYTPREVRD